MLASLLLVFREVLEAALIIGIVCAATRSVAGRARFIGGGVLVGVLGAGLVAGLAEQIGQLAEGVGLELFNAAVLSLAVLMIGWHVIWMAQHGRELAGEMKRLGSAVSSGRRPPYALVLVIALAVLREGSEVVLFMYGLIAGGAAATPMLWGGFAGLLLGAGLGVVLYFGLLRIPMRHFFSATNGLLLLLAAGLAAQAAGFLNQADWLPALGGPLWDSSHLLSEDSLVGQALHTLVGYEARPLGVQLLAYCGTILLLVYGMKRWGMSAKTSPVT